MRLAEAAEKVASTISMGARNGVSVARIQLAPDSLGSIQIHLQRSSDGSIVARVITEHPEAADTLSQGGDDLRRQLQQNGTNLVRLDIQSSNQQQRSSTQEQAGTASGAGSSRGDDGDEDGTADPVTGVSNDIPTHSLSGSALVNVLA